MPNSKLFCKLSFLFSLSKYSNFSQRYQENPILPMPSNPIYKKIGGQNKKSGSERLLQMYSSFRKSYLFEWKRKPLGCETFSSDWPLFGEFCPNWTNFFPINFDQILTLNILSYWKFCAGFKSFYRIQSSFWDQKIFKF